jgi:hypothetical protein
VYGLAALHPWLDEQMRVARVFEDVGFGRVLVRRPQLVRASNERVAKTAHRLRFVSPVPFLCECNDPSCKELVSVVLDEYDRSQSPWILAPGHTVT